MSSGGRLRWPSRVLVRHLSLNNLTLVPNPKRLMRQAGLGATFSGGKARFPAAAGHVPRTSSMRTDVCAAATEQATGFADPSSGRAVDPPPVASRIAD
jgi:hypothetical protein